MTNKEVDARSDDPHYTKESTMKTFLYTWALGLLLPWAALAQTTEESVDAELFKPAIGGGVFAVDRAQILGHHKLYFGAFVNYARNPLVVFTEQNGEVFLVPVRDQSALDIVASVGFRDRFELGIAVPTGLYMDGDNLDTLQGEGTVQGGGLGDIRLNGKLSLLRKQENPDANGGRLALQLEAKLPTGEAFNNSEGFFGDASTAVAAVLLGDIKTDKITLTGNLGLRVRTSDAVDIENITVGNELILGGGLEFKASDALRFGAEVDALANIEADNLGSNPAELRVGAKIGRGNFQVPLGVGVGLSNSFSAPDFRLFAGFTFVGQDDPDGDSITGSRDVCPQTPEDVDNFQDTDGCPEYDNDNDLIVDAEDKCPTNSEDFDGFEDADGCPDFDNDKDSIFDLVDLCPIFAEDQDGFEDLDGCPDLDNDKDSIADKDDECPMLFGFTEFSGCTDTDKDRVSDNRDKCPFNAEDFDGFEDADGCPDFDNDQDGIADFVDLCPGQPENRNGLKDGDGCPDEVYAVIYSGKIVILDMIFFDTNKTTIKAVSNPVLDAVITVLKDHPEVTLVRVEGNADDIGTSKKNQILSEGRANMVVAYLVKGGISANRLEARGNTESNPLTPVEGMDPKTQKKEMIDARDQNRRVEFIVVSSSTASSDLKK